jgi:hypothetical protein
MMQAVAEGEKNSSDITPLHKGMALLNARYVEKDSTFCQGIIKSDYFHYRTAPGQQNAHREAAGFGNDALIFPHAPANRPSDGQTETAAAGMPRAGLLLAAKAFKHFR